MLINVVEENSESQLLQMVERSSKQGLAASLAHFRFSEFQSQPNHDEFVLAIKETLIGLKSAVYFCGDGDVFVVWRGTARNVLKSMVEQVKRTFSTEITYPSKEFPYRYYDVTAHGEELRVLCKKKLNQHQTFLPPQQPPSAPAADWSRIEAPLKFSREHIAALATSIDSRRDRKSPHILIVEDQTFSRLLLHSSLRENHTVHSTENAKEAIALYAQHAPDIVFLDIELPDGSGHRLTELFKSMDKNCFVVMVTAQSYKDDVVRAKENGARAFVLKPYNKQKIFDCIELYHKSRKKPH